MKKKLQKGIATLLVLGLISPTPAFAVDSGTWENSEVFSISETDNWQKSEWAYREEIVLTNTEADQTDYPVKITIPFISGMNADFSDLRFVSADDDELGRVDN